MTTQFHRRTLLTSTLGLGALAVLSACTGTSSLPSVSTSGASGQPSTSPGLSPEVYDALVLAGPVAADSLIAASASAQAIKAQGYLRRGGAETSAIFSLKDPTSGRVTGFDAGLGDLLSRYITGGQDVSKLSQLTQVTSDTRETVLQNKTVDAVIATYSITPARAEKINFAGPYYSSGASIQVKSDNTTIHSVADLNGKTIVTQTNSTGITAIDANVQNAEKLLLAGNDSCIAALVQGRADAYVLDQSILLSNAVRNSQVKVVGNPFTTDPYGIGLNKDEADAKAFVNAFLQTIYDSGVWLNLWKGTVGRFLETEPTPPALGSVEGS